MYSSINLGFGNLMVFPLILIFAIYICIFVFLKSSKYDSFYFSKFKESVIFILVFAGLGGKGLFVLTKINAPFVSISNLFGGFVFYGGFLGAIIGLFFYCKIHHERFLEMTDVMTSLLPLGQAIGRIGCYLNGCCYGKEYVGLFSVNYIIEGRYVKVFPTWFIESIFCFIMFLFFFSMSRQKKYGFYTAIYMIMYSGFRFWIECFRGDKIRGVWGAISTSQIISVFIMLCGIGIAIYSHFRNDKHIIILERKKCHAD